MHASRPTRSPRPLLAALSSVLAVAAACDGNRQDAADAAAAQIRELNATVAALRSENTSLRQRAAAYRHLEFLGEAPAVAEASQRLTILEMGTVPDPRTSDYRDCVVVAVCQPLDDEGRANGPRRLVALPVFHDQQLLPAARFREEMVIRAQLVPWSEMPDTTRSIQRVDETDEFDLEMFAAIAAAGESVTREVRCRTPDGTGPDQPAAIAASLRRIEERRAPHGSYEQWHDELAAVRADLRARSEAAGGLPLIADGQFLRNLHYINHRPSAQWPAPQIAFFRSLRDQLAERGIDLIVAPFPEREQISALQLANEPPADGVVHAYRELWYERVLQAGIEAVDLRPALVDAIGKGDPLFYCATDGHPANGAIVVAAREIASRLQRYGDLQASFEHMLVQDMQYAIPRSHKQFPPSAHEGTPFHADVVLRPDRSHVPLNPPSAPILMLGDSFLQCPGFYDVPSAALPAQITKETGVLTRTFTVGGGAPQLMVHLARAEPEVLAGVRVVVFVFREDYMFMHSETEPKYRWEIVPLLR